MQLIHGLGMDEVLSDRTRRWQATRPAISYHFWNSEKTTVFRTALGVRKYVWPVS